MAKKCDNLPYINNPNNRILKNRITIKGYGCVGCWRCSGSIKPNGCSTNQCSCICKRVISYNNLDIRFNFIVDPEKRIQVFEIDK